MSEDCLYMGIIRPANITQTKLPVMVSTQTNPFHSTIYNSLLTAQVGLPRTRRVQQWRSWLLFSFQPDVDRPTLVRYRIPYPRSCCQLPNRAMGLHV